VLSWLRERFYPDIGIVPIDESAAERENYRALKEKLESMTRREQMAWAQRDPEICEILMEESTVTTADYNQLRYWRDR
jgi:hypothetical protein